MSLIFLQHWDITRESVAERGVPWRAVGIAGYVRSRRPIIGSFCSSLSASYYMLVW